MAERLVTAEDLKGASMSSSTHIKMAKGGYAWISRCREHPRLSVYTGRENRQQRAERVFLVDGLECRDLASAAEALNRTPEENEQMAEQQEAAAGLNLQGGTGEKKWTFADGIKELKREQHARERVYPRLIHTGSLDEADANRQNKALAGTLTFLEFCAPYEAELREFLKAKIAARQKGDQ